MIELGKRQTLKVVKEVGFGVYLGDGEDTVLLPKKQVPDGIGPGAEVEVFVYRDSDDRLISTVNFPKIELGKIAVLEVVDTNGLGAFMDWGLEKDLFLPFSQQLTRVEKGGKYLVSLYEDKSGRLCATMKVYPMLEKRSPYVKGDTVEGIIYDVSKNFGVYVAVDDRFSARIPPNEVFTEMEIGQTVKARVTAVKEDGKLDLSVRGKIPVQTDADARMILDRIRECDGSLPFNDDTPAQKIAEEFHISKKAFKRAVGRLLKEGKIVIGEKNIALKGNK